MLKLLRLGMVLHSKLSYLATLLSSGMLVCSLMIPLNGGSAWNREQNDSEATGMGNRLAFISHWWEISWVFDLVEAVSCYYVPCSLGQCL